MEYLNRRFNISCVLASSINDSKNTSVKNLYLFRQPYDIIDLGIVEMDVLKHAVMEELKWVEKSKYLMSFFLAQAMYTGNALLLSTEQLKYFIERQ